MAATSAEDILLRPLFLFFGFIIFGGARAELSSGPLMVGTWPHKNEEKRHIKNPENERESVERVKYQLSVPPVGFWLSHFLLSTFIATMTDPPGTGGAGGGGGRPSSVPSLSTLAAMALPKEQLAALAQLVRGHEELVREKEELAESKTALANSWLAFEEDLAQREAALAEREAVLAQREAALVHDRAEMEAVRDEWMWYFIELFRRVYNYALWFDVRETGARKVEARAERLTYATLLLLAGISFLFLGCLLHLFFVTRHYIIVLLASVVVFFMGGLGLVYYRFGMFRG